MKVMILIIEEKEDGDSNSDSKKIFINFYSLINFIETHFPFLRNIFSTISIPVFNAPPTTGISLIKFYATGLNVSYIFPPTFLMPPQSFPQNPYFFAGASFLI